MLKKRKELNMSDSSDGAGDYDRERTDAYKKSFRSERFKLEMSALYSKSLYPLSLGGIEDRDEESD